MVAGKSNKRGSKNNAASPIAHKTPAGDNKDETHQGSDDLMASRSSIEELLKNIEKQQLAISRLETKVDNLEGKVIMLESQIHICGTVNENQRVMIDNQEQYSRRACMVVSGMAVSDTDAEHGEDFGKVVNVLSEESGIDEETIKVNIDKIHPIGVIGDNGKQQRKIKFKSDSFKEKMFRNHKVIKRQRSSCSKNTNSPIIKFKRSLTKRRIKLLSYAEELIGDIEEIRFAYADMHGNLELLLNEPMNRNYAYDFTTPTELAEIISKLDSRAYAEQDRDWRSSFQQGDVFM